MTKRSLALGVLAGVLTSALVVAASEKIGVTNVRVGPTAAIGIATSADGQTVYVANGNGLFKSIDGGSTWMKLPVE